MMIRRRLSFLYQLLVWFIVRQMKRSRRRAITVLLGIGLGAAVFTSVRLSVNASLDSFTKSMDLIAGKADLVVVRPGGQVPDSLVATLLKDPSVRAASPVITAYAAPDREDAEPFLLIGLDPILDRPLRDWRTKDAAEGGPSKRAFDLISKPGAVVLSSRLAGAYGLQADSSFPVEHSHGKATLHVVGVLTGQGLASVEGGRVAIADISTMQELTGLLGEVDRIDLLLDEKASKEDIERIRSLLPAGVSPEKPDEAKQSGAVMIRSYQLNLSVLSFVSLFVGMFLVYSLVALNARSRRHELAVLRSIGASSRMIFFLFVAEGGLLGALGWLAAIPMSAILVKYLLAGVSSTISNLFVRVQVDRLGLDAGEVMLSFAITVLVSVLAAYQPAREAMDVSPREALDVHGSGLKQMRSPKGLAVTGLALIAAIWPLLRLPAPSGLPLPGYVATFLLFTGFSLLSPYCLQLVGSYFPPVLRRIQGEPAYLAGRYVRDAGTRTAISVGALITAMALFVALATMVHSFRNTVEAWVNQSISGDVFVRPKMGEINQYRFPLAEEVVEKLESLRPEADLLPYRRIPLRHGEHPYQLEAIDMEVFRKYGGFLFAEGNEADVMPALIRGEGVVVSEVFSNKTGLGTGDRYTARIGGITLDLPILGIVRDYRTQGGVVEYSLRSLEELTGRREWSGSRIYIKDEGDTGVARTAGAASPAAEKLRNELLLCCADRYGIGVSTGTDLRGEIMRIFDETFSITTVLLLIALIVAALGITTTLTVLVLERKRELNTLLAVGAGFSQIRTMIFWESLLMVGVGECVGLACGFILSYILIFVINRQSFGWTFLYSADWVSVAASIPLILVTALLASLPAIRLVFRYSPALALRE